MHYDDRICSVSPLYLHEWNITERKVDTQLVHGNPERDLTATGELWEIRRGEGKLRDAMRSDAL